MNDKYVKLADVKRKLRYILKSYGVGSFVREKIKSALNDLPYSVKGDLETTLEASDVQPVKRGRWIKDEKGTFHHCSECGGKTFRDVDSWGLECQEYCTDYCPHCGARMDGDTNVKNTTMYSKNCK